MFNFAFWTKRIMNARHSAVFLLWQTNCLGMCRGSRKEEECQLSKQTHHVWFWSVGHSDGPALHFNWTVPGVWCLKQSPVKCSLQMLKSVQDDSSRRCSLTSNRNWTHSSLLSGSCGRLNRCTPPRHESHATTEHIVDLIFCHSSFKHGQAVLTFAVLEISVDLHSRCFY